MENESKKQIKRIPEFDDFRGILILFYLIVQMFNLKRTFAMPSWFYHSTTQVGTIPFLQFNISDFGPAIFFFIIGLTVCFAFNKRAERDGKKQAYKHVFYRNLAVIGIAAIAQFIGNLLTNSAYDWNALFSVGFVGLLIMPFLSMKTLYRGISGFVILFIYQLFNTPILSVLGGNEGGIGACFGYLALTLFATVLSDLYQKKIWQYAIGTLGVWVLGIISQFFVIPHFRSYNCSYILLSLAVVATVFLLFALLSKYVIKKPIPCINTIGKNLIFFFAITYAICYTLRVVIAVPIDLWLVVLLDIIFYIVYCVIAYVFNKKNIVIKL